MFDAALLTKLASDGALAGYLSTYMGQPAIFSEDAPDAAVEPYLVFTITRLAADYPAVDTFNIFVDYFNRDTSRVDARKAMQRVEFLLDQVNLTSDRYDTIRVFYYSEGPVPDPDPRVIHRNIQFTARAGRKAWCQQL